MPNPPSLAPKRTNKRIAEAKPGAGDSLLRGLLAHQKTVFFQALVAMAMADEELAPEEQELIRALAIWTGLGERDAATIIRKPLKLQNLKLRQLPGWTRLGLFAAGVLVVLEDGRIEPREKTELARLASMLHLEPKAAHQIVSGLRATGGAELDHIFAVTRSQKPPKDIVVYPTFTIWGMIISRLTSILFWLRILPPHRVPIFIAMVGLPFLAGMGTDAIYGKVSAKRKYGMKHYSFDDVDEPQQSRTKSRRGSG